MELHRLTVPDGEIYAFSKYRSHDWLALGCKHFLSANSSFADPKLVTVGRVYAGQNPCWAVPKHGPTSITGRSIGCWAVMKVLKSSA